MTSGTPDLSKPNVSRIYDYLLGGKDNFLADRVAAEQMIEKEPALPHLARANRTFLGRAVRYLVDAGVRQFIDVGTGLPTQGHVHELVPEDAHVVYVDSDPVVLAHSRALIAGRPGTVIVDGDLRRPNRLLADPAVRQLIDFGRPCAVLLCAVLHFLGEDDSPDGVVATFCECIAPGSYLVLTHATGDAPAAAARAAAVRDLYAATDRPGTLRPLNRIGGFLQGMELVEPGLVPVSTWRPDRPTAIDPQSEWLYGAVGRKPDPGSTP